MTRGSSIIPAKSWHCGWMVRRLHAGQRANLASLGLDPHTELRRAFDGSAEAFAWMLDGELAALGGVTGTLLSSSGTAWLALSEEAIRHPVAMARVMLGRLDYFLKTKRELDATFFGEDEKAVEFAYRLGFERYESGIMAQMRVTAMRIGGDACLL